MISTPSYGRTDSGSFRLSPGWTPVARTLSTMSRSRWVPTKRMSWPLSLKGNVRAEPMTPDPRIAMLVMTAPLCGFGAQLRQPLELRLDCREQRPVDLSEQMVVQHAGAVLGLEALGHVGHCRRGLLDRGVPADTGRAQDSRAEVGRLRGVGPGDGGSEHVGHDLAPQVAVRAA